MWGQEFALFGPCAPPLRTAMGAPDDRKSSESPTEKLPTEALRDQPRDYVAATLRSVLGAAPYAGALLAEIVTVTLPGQRLDRVCAVLAEVARKLGELDEGLLRARLTDENATDLLQEAVLQAQHAVSEERRRYIAELVSKGLSSEAIVAQESKYLLRMLGEINDVEVIWLRHFGRFSHPEAVAFHQTHASVLAEAPARLGSGRSQIDKMALQKSYKEHLTRLGLLERKYELDYEAKPRRPVFDRSTGATKVQGYSLTSLGKMLLQQIGLPPEEPPGM